MNNVQTNRKGGAAEAAAKGHIVGDCSDGTGGQSTDSATSSGVDRYLVQKEAAKYLRLSSRTLERYRVVGTGPRFIKAGRRVLYRRDALDDWTSERTFSSTAAAQASNTNRSP